MSNQLLENQMNPVYRFMSGSNSERDTKAGKVIHRNDVTNWICNHNCTAPTDNPVCATAYDPLSHGSRNRLVSDPLWFDTGEMWKVFVILSLCVTLVSASCPVDCWCPPEPPSCPAGVSLMLDGCGCCKVCARQLFEDCSKTQPCDHTKGLECNFGGRYGSDKGICRAVSGDGRTCEYNNKIYQNGEIFRPNCKHQCTCMDGAVGCVSLCPHELTLPKLGCARPRRVKVPGLCCEQLVCPQEAKIESSVEKKHRKKDRPSEDDLTDRNELAPAWRGESKSLPAFRSQPVGHLLVRGVECVSQTSAWSPCSKSCGTGTSTRVTNSNTQCKLVKETRICEVRPCNQLTSSRVKNGQKCNRIEKASRPVKLTHAGCSSLKKFQPRYCGSCSDGRCCRPHRTQTSSVRFQCRDGEIISRMVMVIESCKCNLGCSDNNERTAAPHRLFNDIHKLKV
ncbi:CCN family member 1-like [Pempheris klunzingeri]|uniref:CCN family member 1-like n=1 Tax=Pempheris klunzingeri TaxID=3127111 RepID=UPI0039804521